jgi:hypothetical protein
MRRLSRHRPSPAMVVSVIALIVALGGTSYAALKLPKNSVSTKQLKKSAVTNSKIKNNAVTGAKVKSASLTGSDIKDHTLSGRDIAGGSLPAGAQGPVGPQGTVGPQGPKGDTGDTPTKVLKRTAGAGDTITIATYGPFTLKGDCTGTTGNPTAQWKIATSQDHSAFTDYDNSYLSDFSASDGDKPIEYSSTSSDPASPDMEGPYDGTFAALSADLNTYITGSLSTGTYVGGASNAPCEFYGVVFSG